MGKEIEKVKVIGSDGKEYERVKCQCWTRVMGYLRPVDGYNIGKKSEFFGRKYFDEDKIDNSEFLKKYLLSKPCCHVD